MTIVLYHVGLTVSSLERSVAFYRDVVGMVPEDLGRRAEFDGSRETGGRTLGALDGVTYIRTRSETFAALTDNPEAETKSVWLRAGSFALQLVEYVHGGGGRAQVGHSTVGSPHLCFYVEDVDRMHAQLRAAGNVRILSDVIQIVPWARSFYVVDPDGVPVELLQSTGEG